MAPEKSVLVKFESPVSPRNEVERFSREQRTRRREEREGSRAEDRIDCLPSFPSRLRVLFGLKSAPLRSAAKQGIQTLTGPKNRSCTRTRVRMHGATDVPQR